MNSWVQTEMGRGAASAVGMEDAPVTLDQSVAGLTKSVCRHIFSGGWHLF
jgi:hypothetical protein